MQFEWDIMSEDEGLLLEPDQMRVAGECFVVVPPRIVLNMCVGECLAGASGLLSEPEDAKSYANRRDYWANRRDIVVSNVRQGGDFGLNILGSLLDDHLTDQDGQPAWLTLDALRDACARKSVEACVAEASLLAEAGFEGDQTADACSALETACFEGAPGACHPHLPPISILPASRDDRPGVIHRRR